MPSNILKVFLGIIALSPGFLFLYILKIIKNFSNLRIYVNLKSVELIISGLKDFFQNQIFIILFLVLVFIALGILSYAKKRFAIGRIEVKSIKPGDPNLLTTLFSVIPLFAKISIPSLSDGLLVLIVILLGIVFGLTMKNSYHFNLLLKLFLGYSHYEIQTKEEVTYVMISKKQLINKKLINKYVKLTDQMLLNVSDKP